MTRRTQRPKGVSEHPIFNSVLEQCWTKWWIPTHCAQAHPSYWMVLCIDSAWHARRKNKNESKSTRMICVSHSKLFVHPIISSSELQRLLEWPFLLVLTALLSQDNGVQASTEAQNLLHVSYYTLIKFEILNPREKVTLNYFVNSVQVWSHTPCAHHVT